MRWYSKQVRGCVARAGVARRKFTFRFIFPRRPARPALQKSPEVRRFSGNLSGESGPGPAWPHHWRAAKGGEQLRVGRAPGPVGRERGNGGRPIARGHSPAPRFVQNNNSRNCSSRRQVERKAGAMPASSRRPWAGRARPSSLEPGVRSLCQPRVRGSC